MLNASGLEKKLKIYEVLQLFYILHLNALIDPIF